MEPWLIALIVILGVVLIIAVAIIAWVINTINWFRQTQVKIDEANSGIDVALTKRYDLLTKTIATVKGYAKHEAETLQQVISKRNPNVNATMGEKSELANMMSDVASKLNIVLENYPDLKANTNFMELQVQIRDVEEHLQAARRLYNANVSIYNQSRVTWPNSIIANWKHFEKRDFFEVEETKKADVKIEF